MRSRLEVRDFGGILNAAFQRVGSECAEGDGAGAEEAAGGPKRRCHDS